MLQIMPRTNRCRSVLAAALLTAVAQRGDAAVQPTVVQTQFPTPDVVVASLVLEAPAAATTDAAPLIQAAVDEAAAAGGAVVFLRAGRYRLAGPVVVREGVTLRGDWQRPDQGGAGQGTILMPVSGRGQADGPPAITLERGAGLREVTVWYPEQVATAVVAYPWTIRTSERVAGDNYTVHNVTLVNPYQAFKTGPEWNELHTVRNVFGTPLKTGIWVDTCTDIGRLIEVDFGARWWVESGLDGAPTSAEARAALARHLAAEAVGVDMGRSDWEYVYRVRTTGYAVGMKIRAGAQGTTNAALFGCEFTGGEVGLLVERLNGIGVALAGCRLDGRVCGLRTDPGLGDTGVQLNACDLAGGNAAADLQGHSVVSFVNCRFTDWQETAVAAAAGDVSLLGCEFARTGTHVRLAAGVSRARLLSNRFEGTAGIDNRSAGDVEIAGGGPTFDRPDVSPHPTVPDPRPARTDLVVVTDCGADPAAEDNTEAFARALAKAGQAGGGTVYVPAGLFRIRGRLTVPTGVELRGIFDVPHHTISAGSVLLVTDGRGQEDGTPFLSLEPKSGVRGLTLWWPEQNVAKPEPYPWAVRALGPGCWLVDVTLGNAWQGVDFWTNPSTGHLVRYLAGGFLRRGLWVSKSDGDGYVEDTQFNPHYTVRLPKDLPRPPITEGEINQVIEFQRAKLEGIIFGRCAREHVKGTFLYAAYDGIGFRDDGGGANARVISHGSDTCSRPAAMDGAQSVDFVLAQLVPLSKHEVGGMVTGERFQGRTRFFCSQLWAGQRTAVLDGHGDVLLQQANSLSGPVTVKGGRSRLQGLRFQRSLAPHITLEPGVEAAELVANLAPAALRVANQAADHVRQLANAADLASARPEAARGEFATGWEDGEPQGLADAVATNGGGLRSVSGVTCRRVADQAHGGTYALRLAGTADDPAYSYAYCKVFEEPLGVWPDTELSYWIRPLNERGQATCVDLVFSDGSTLRDSSAAIASGGPARTAGSKAKVGEWAEIRIRLGATHAGRSIRTLMVAYDSRSGGGPFAAVIDDLRVSSALAKEPQADLRPTPPGGVVPVGTTVAIAGAAGLTVTYTLDGSEPTPDSPRYADPIVLDKPGLTEMRYRRGSRVAAALFEVVPR